MKTRIALAAASVLFAGGAQASPNISLYVAGSTIIVEASNTESRSYSCHGSYRADYNQYGTNGSQVFPANFTIAANSSGAVINHSTPWAASTLSASWVNAPQCT